MEKTVHEVLMDLQPLMIGVTVAFAIGIMAGCWAFRKTLGELWKSMKNGGL